MYIAGSQTSCRKQLLHIITFIFVHINQTTVWILIATFLVLSIANLHTSSVQNIFGWCGTLWQYDEKDFDKNNTMTIRWERLWWEQEYIVSEFGSQWATSWLVFCAGVRTSGMYPKSCKQLGVKNTRREDLLAKKVGSGQKWGGNLCKEYMLWAKS